jgi:predicted nucleic acid-binding protein
MVLVDTSVWISHLRDGSYGLMELLNNGDVLCHPFIIGELACGNIKNRNEIISLLRSLPMAKTLVHDEVLKFTEDRKLARRGLGFIDVHLLASAILSDSPMWSLDKKMSNIALELNIDFIPGK